MIVSADLPEELAAKIDALVQDPEPPVWPFSSRTIKPEALTADERKALDKFQKDAIEYEAAKGTPERPRSRSAVVKMILTAYFAGKNGKK